MTASTALTENSNKTKNLVYFKKKNVKAYREQLSVNTYRKQLSAFHFLKIREKNLKNEKSTIYFISHVQGMQGKTIHVN